MKSSLKKRFFLSVFASSVLMFANTLNADNSIIKTKRAGHFSNYKKFAQSEAILLLRDGVLNKNGMLNSAFKSLLDRNFGADGYKIQVFSSFSSIHIKTKNYSTEDLLNTFKGRTFSNFVKTATPNYINVLNQKSNDSYYSKLWAIENTGQNVNNTSGTNDADMDVKEAWDIEEGSKNVVIAVLDTGVDYTHEDLRDNMYGGNAKHGYDFAGDNDGNNDDDPMPDKPYDDNGHYHGTHVAGIIGAVGNNAKGVSGVAQRVSIMALKVFRPNGYGYNSDILEALDYVSKKVDNGDNIVAINASFGGGGGSQDDSMNNAIKKLGNQGVIFCAAAGNDGKNVDNDPVYPACYNASNIIAVAASDQDDKLAGFSNYGKKSIDVAAPGKNILSTYPENKYAYMDGTSMATPNVTATVALIASRYPSYSVSERRDLILQNVDKIDSYSSKIASEGRVNVNNALQNNDGAGDNDDDNGGNDGDDQKTNTPPKANDDSASTNKREKVTIDVLQNDTDDDKDSLKISSVSTPDCGEASISDNKAVYDPKECKGGKYSFEYTISDQNGGEDKAKVTIDVKNRAPKANDDSAEVKQKKKVVIKALDNDSDPDGDELNIESVSNPSCGSVSYTKNEITYDSKECKEGTYSFNYKINDNDSLTSSAKISVKVKKESSGWGGFFGSSNNDDDNSDSNSGWFF